MAFNQFVPFATGAGANALTPDQLASDPSRQTGVQAGTARSILANAAWRQGTTVASMIGAFIVDSAAQNANDDGNIPALLASFKAGISAVATAAAAAQAPLPHQLVHRGTNTGSVNALIADIQPNIAAYDLDALYLIGLSGTNTGPVTANLEGLGVRAVVRSNGRPLQPGDISRIAALSYDGESFVLLNLAQEIAPPGSGFAGSQQRFGYAPQQNVPSVLSATFTAVFSGVVQCVSTLNSSPANGNISNSGNINVAGQSFSGAADTVQGSSVSTSFARVMAGQSVTVSSTATPADPTPFSVSQYLNYVFIPS